MDLLLPVPGVCGKPWCAIFAGAGGVDSDTTYWYKNIGLQTLRSCFERHQAELGLRVRKIVAMRGASLCNVAYKDGKEVLLVCKPAGAGGMRFEELPCVGSGKVGSWGLVTMSRDSIFVIEGGDSGNHEVVVYEFRTRAWRVISKLPATMVRYAASLHRFSSVVLGHFLYILLLPPQEGVERRTCNYKIAALDFHRNEWAEFEVTTPRAFTRIRLVGVHERLLLVGVEEGIIPNVDDSYCIMNVFLSKTEPITCVEVSEMPGGFCAALAEETSNSVFKFKAIVCGHRDSIFFMSSRGKPVVYSTTKNAWSYVPLFSKMQHLPSHVHRDNHYLHGGSDSAAVALRVRFRSGQVTNHGRGAAAGRPPRWRYCQIQPGT
jgi:hypothetical protein